MPADDTIGVPVKWSDEVPEPLPANVMHIHRTPFDEVILTFGHASSLLYGSQDEQDEQLAALSKKGITVRPNARLVLSFSSARRLKGFLCEMLEEEGL